MCCVAANSYKAIIIQHYAKPAVVLHTMLMRCMFQQKYMLLKLMQLRLS